MSAYGRDNKQGRGHSRGTTAQSAVETAMRAQRCQPLSALQLGCDLATRPRRAPWATPAVCVRKQQLQAAEMARVSFGTTSR